MISGIVRKPDCMQQAFQSDMRDLLAERVPLAVALFLLLTGMAGGVEWFYYPGRWQALVAIYAGSAAPVLLIAIVAARLAPQWAAFGAPLATNVLPGCLIGYFAWVHGDAEVLVTLLVVYLYGLVIIHPWGWRGQALGTAGVPLGYLIALYGGATPAETSVFCSLALLAATALAILGAGLLESHRFAAYRYAACLQRVNEQKNEFLGMAAHDLRNPLGAIQTYSELLLQNAGNPLTEEHRKIIDRIKFLSASMLHLVGDLLDISAIEAGELKLDLQETDLNSLVEDTVTMNGLLAQRKRVALVFENGGPPPLLQVDPGKIRQVLDNLITNAIKFSREETTVTVQVYQDNGTAVIAVRDQGPGIPVHEREKLFQPFCRAIAGGAAREQGTGLGLAIVRKIIEAHRGRVWLDSDLGKGSAFYVSLPTQAREVDGASTARRTSTSARYRNLLGAVGA
jgi:signal transduction histidine kinase